MTSIKRHFKSARGAELIEFALVFPLLLMVVLGIVDFGLLFQRMEVVTNAAREGARIAVLPGYGATDVCQRAVSYMITGGVTLTPANPSCNCALNSTCTSPSNPTITISDAAIDLGNGSTPLAAKQVFVEYNSTYLFLGPIMRFFGGSLTSVPVRGVAVMRSEIPGS